MLNFYNISLGGFITLSILSTAVFIFKKRNLEFFAYSLFCICYSGLIISMRIKPFNTYLIFYKYIYMTLVNIVILATILYTTSLKVIVDKRIKKINLICYSIICLLLMIYFIFDLNILKLLYYSAVLLFTIYYFILILFKTKKIFVLKNKKKNILSNRIIIISIWFLLLFFIVTGILLVIYSSVVKFPVFMYSGFYIFSILNVIALMVNLYQEHQELKTKKEIEKINEKLRKQKDELEQQQFDLEMAHAELEKKNKQLEKAHIEKINQFINLAHVYSNERTEIMGIVELLQSETLSEEEKQNYCQQILKCMEVCNRHTRNRFDLVETDDNKLLYKHHRPLDIYEYLQDRLSQFETFFESKSIKLIRHIHTDIFITIDPLALDRVLSNILLNCYNFSEPGGRVTVKCFRENGNVVLSVEDTGDGMSEKQIEMLKEPYSQTYGRLKSKQGLGLGLLIVKKILNSIEAEFGISSRPGKGTLVTVIFNQAELEPGKRTTCDFSVLDLSGFAMNKNFEPMSYEKHKSNILFVEDNREHLAILTTYFQKKYNVFYATSGQEALRKIFEIPVPDVMITDIVMETADAGLELHKEIKGFAKFAETRVIYLSAVDDQRTRHKAIELDAYNYRVKPYMIRELENDIDNIIKQKEQEKEKIRKIEQQVNGNDIEKFENFVREYKITKKEIEIIEMLKRGFSYEEIAFELKKSKHTINHQLTSLYKKCNINSAIELINLLQKL